MLVYVLEIANDSWVIHEVYKDRTKAEEAGRNIVESQLNEYEHYTVTPYELK